MFCVDASTIVKNRPFIIKRRQAYRFARDNAPRVYDKGRTPFLNVNRPIIMCQITIPKKVNVVTSEEGNIIESSANFYLDFNSLSFSSPFLNFYSFCFLFFYLDFVYHFPLRPIKAGDVQFLRCISSGLPLIHA